MEDALKICAIAVAAALCAVVVKKQTPEIGIVLTLVAGSACSSDQDSGHCHRDPDRR